MKYQRRCGQSCVAILIVVCSQITEMIPLGRIADPEGTCMHGCVFSTISLKCNVTHLRISQQIKRSMTLILLVRYHTLFISDVLKCLQLIYLCECDVAYERYCIQHQQQVSSKQFLFFFFKEITVKLRIRKQKNWAVAVHKMKVKTMFCNKASLSSHLINKTTSLQ